MGTGRRPDLTESTGATAEYGPWNPGIVSQLPRALLPLSTMFRVENVRSTIPDVEELHDLTGLPVVDLVVFRPERLVLHELLVRVTADLYVPIGDRVEDLGINFRQMTSTILARYLVPHMGAFAAAYDALRKDLSEFIAEELATMLLHSVPSTGAPATPGRTKKPRRRSGLVGWLLGSRSSGAVEAVAEPAHGSTVDEAIRAWQQRAASAPDGIGKAACRSLARVLSAVVGTHGEVWGTSELLGRIATDLACNDFGSDELGRLMNSHFLAAARAEGYALLPAQERPVIMNTKGASAAGKSTMRPKQKLLAERIGAVWSEFALISPDIWRKQLLDYASLGPAYKYGGACTGEELRIIDHKLDRYMAQKAGRSATSHLLIDRFRFDSFAADSNEAGSNLLTRFGHTVYLFFMITRPEQIVERAWQRGLEVGRYKTVDDLLAHNIEAYAGMPELFFTWALHTDKEVHYEFLDNTIAYGDPPRTVAFGWNGELNVLDVGFMLNIERFRRVDVDATGPAVLYRRPEELTPERNTAFLVNCVRRLPRVNFANHATGQIYLSFVAGAPVAVDEGALRLAMNDPDTRAGILAVAPDIEGALRLPPVPEGKLAAHMGADRIHTLGQWGCAT